MMINPNVSRKNRLLGSAIALAVGGLTIGACNEFTKPDRISSAADNIARNVQENLKPGNKIDVATAVVSVDAGVNFRSTPVKINTNNSALISGNNITNDETDDTLTKPTILVRPLIVKNETRFTDSDPKYWLGGIQRDRVVWIGMNDETRDKVHVFQRQKTDGERPELIESITVDTVSQQDGITFDMGGYAASAGLIRPSEGLSDPFMQAKAAEGYSEIRVLTEE